MYFNWLKRDKEKILNDKKNIPVSVVLVVIKSRLEFVNAFVLPSIEANNIIPQNVKTTFSKILFS